MVNWTHVPAFVWPGFNAKTCKFSIESKEKQSEILRLVAGFGPAQVCVFAWSEVQNYYSKTFCTSNFVISCWHHWRITGLLWCHIRRWLYWFHLALPCCCSFLLPFNSKSPKGTGQTNMFVSFPLVAQELLFVRRCGFTLMFCFSFLELHLMFLDLMHQ